MWDKGECVCNEVWANTASDQIHNWGTLNHVSIGSCSICMSCLASIVCAHTYLCAYSCMNAPATMILVMCLWELSYAYDAYIQKPTSPLISSDTTAKQFLLAFSWSLTPLSMYVSVPNIRRSSLNHCRNFKSGEWKLVSEIAFDPTPMHLRSAEAKSWMKIKAGPNPHRSSQPVSGTFLSNERGACSPAQAHILFQIALAAHCLCPVGHIRGVHHHICTHTRTIFLCPLWGKSCAAAWWFVLSTTGFMQRTTAHTSCAHVHTSLQNMDTHWVTSQSKSVIILWSNTIQY